MDAEYLPGQRRGFLPVTWLACTSSQNAAADFLHTSCLEDLTLPDRPIWKCQADNLVVSREFNLNCSSTFCPTVEAEDWRDTDIIEDDQRAVDTTNGVVLQVRLHRIGRRFSWVAHGCNSVGMGSRYWEG